MPRHPCGHWVEAGGRLVQKQNAGRDDQRGGDVEPAPHAAGIVHHLLRRGFGQAEGGEQLVGAGLRGAPAKVPQAGQ
jgi:hypothetical protein